MRSILIGSRAYSYLSGRFHLSIDSDWDILVDDIKQASINIASLREQGFTERIEIHDLSKLNNSKIFDLVSPRPFNKIDIGSLAPLRNNKKAFSWNLDICDIRLLALLKRSHSWRVHKFERNITILFKQLLPTLGCSNFSDFKHTLNKELLEFLEQRTQLSYVAFSEKHPSLNKSSQSFFNDKVEKKYDHDWLHTLVAYYDKPLYTKIQPNPDRVWCSQKLWNNLSLEDKNKCVAEEVWAIAFERYIIPKQYRCSFSTAYFQALSRVCTNLCSGWFRDHAIDNFSDIYNLFDNTKAFNIKRRILDFDYEKEKE
jgi:hypothetical protein